MAFPGGFREYMAVKRQKLAGQAQEVAVAGAKSTILQGLTLYFNGYTGTGHLTMIEFKDLVLVHGALVRDKLDPDVTHIIATQITDRKMTLLRKPVVKPDWLIDSIDNRKLLPWIDYRLYLEIAPSQKTLGTFFASGESSPKRATVSVASDDLSPKLLSTPPFNPDASIASNATHLESRVEDPETGLSEEPDPIPVEEEEEEESEPPDYIYGVRQQTLDLDDPRIKAVLCTAPGFLDNYFGSSRLHHLSTWKSELKDYVFRNGPKPKNRKSNQPKVIIHIDMDCFFAAVGLRDRPHLRNQPVVVAHSLGLVEKSTSEIASCNYIARGFGIRNGMSLGRARDHCKDVQVIPYEFDKYDQCTKAMYAILLRSADEVQAVSCDEAYLDITSSVTEPDTGQENTLAESLRTQIYEATGCVSSIGIGPNKLIARMATKIAKPDGIFMVTAPEVPSFMQSQMIKDLPGVGWVLAQKMEKQNLKTCQDLSSWTVGALQREFGPKTGTTLYQACRGIDPSPLENKPQQSVGAEVNWAMRFRNAQEVEEFMQSLSKEVAKRMGAAKVRGKQVTVKAKKKMYEGEPAKYLGCGECENLSKSNILSTHSNDWRVIFKESFRSLMEMQIPFTELRGLGIHVSKLDNRAETHRVSDSQTTLQFESHKAPITTNDGRIPPPPCREIAMPQAGNSKSVHTFVDNSHLARYEVNPEEIDMEILKELPASLQAEILAQMRPREPPAKEPPLQQEGSSKQQPKGPPKEFDPRTYLPTASQVDPEVLAALPEDLRREHEAAMRKRNLFLPKKNKGIGKGKDSGPPKPKIIPPPVPAPTLAGLTGFDNIRPLLHQWINDCRAGPDDEDVAEIEAFIDDLIKCMELETLDLLLKWMVNKVGVKPGAGASGKGKENAGWASVTRRLVERANTAMMKAYGCKLKGL
ncbi:hypothetical protein DFS34DRAFT_636103 [Phlyctochytrium arcticum]|nr:hypothetical protein DFS34DRAFT_636103 [Phlyctochytrium arcticum]